MIVRTVMDKREIIPTPMGDRYRIEYVRVDDPDDGSVYLKEIGKVNIQDEIDSNRPVKVSELVNRYFRGDFSALGDDSRCFYGDVSNIGSLESVVDLAQTVQFVPVSTDVVESEDKSDAES